jgi:hypothetical protein
MQKLKAFDQLSNSKVKIQKLKAFDWLLNEPCRVIFAF